MKTNICKICNWKGRTHLHHIIRIVDYGSQESDNIIEICPNHHAEACEDEDIFAKKYNLFGKKKSEQEINDLAEFTDLLFRFNYGELVNINRMLELWQKYNFNILDAISFALGITKNSVRRYIPREDIKNL